VYILLQFARVNRPVFGIHDKPVGTSKNSSRQVAANLTP